MTMEFNCDHGIRIVWWSRNESQRHVKTTSIPMFAQQLFHNTRLLTSGYNSTTGKHTNSQRAGYTNGQSCVIIWYLCCNVSRRHVKLCQMTRDFLSFETELFKILLWKTDAKYLTPSNIDTAFGNIIRVIQILIRDIVLNYCISLVYIIISNIIFSYQILYFPTKLISWCIFRGEKIIFFVLWTLKELSKQNIVLYPDFMELAYRSQNPSNNFYLPLFLFTSPEKTFC